MIKNFYVQNDEPKGVEESYYPFPLIIGLANVCIRCCTVAFYLVPVLLFTL